MRKRWRRRGRRKKTKWRDRNGRINRHFALF